VAPTCGPEPALPGRLPPADRAVTSGRGWRGHRKSCRCQVGAERPWDTQEEPLSVLFKMLVLSTCFIILKEK
jgi:hypothetical protein